MKEAKSWQPPPSDPPATKVSPWMSPGPWCEPKAGWKSGELPPTGAPSPPPDDDGCGAGFEGGHSSGPGTAALLLIMLAGALILRRRRA